MTTEQSLAALLEAAPPELREALTFLHQRVPTRGRQPLPVPEATLAAMRWVLENDGSFSADPNYGWSVLLLGVNGWRKGADIFSAIRAAIGGE